MEKICNFIENNISLNYISYYNYHLNEEYIIYDSNNNIEIIEYIYEYLLKYFIDYNYEIIINYNKPSLIFILNNRKCEIIYIPLYWIVNIDNI
jgi:hypothetical protein